MTTILTLNIGLNNNPLTFEQLISYLKADRVFTVEMYNSTPVIGEYDGVTEETLVISVSCSYTSMASIIQRIEQLCSVFTQECIAVSSDYFDMLVYNTTFTGQRNKFDSNYFINI